MDNDLGRMENDMDARFWVDIPQLNGFGQPMDEWRNIAEFPTREEAVAYIKEHFGGDENGMVCLLSPS